MYNARTHQTFILHILAEDFKHALLASQIMTQTQYDPRTETVSLQLDAAEFNEFIHALKEEDVYKLKHPADFAIRP